MGDDHTFDALWNAHHRRVHAYALRRTDDASAQDAVSETFLVAWRRRPEIPPGDPLPWLIGIARHVLANQARGRRRQDALADVMVTQAERHAPAPDAHVPVLTALAALTETDREALLLVGWDGLTPSEAARSLGCTPVAFRVRLLRARRALRAELEADLEPQLATEGAS